MAPTPANQIPVSVRRKTAAVHEAGHALVAIVYKRDVTGAMLRTPNGLSGETQFKDAADVMLDLNEASNRLIIENAIIVLLAGQVAEAAFWDKLKSSYAPQVDTHRHDDAEIERYKKGFDFTKEQDVAFIGHCKKKAQFILYDKRSQAAIEEIATKLCKSFYVSRAEIDEILIKHDVIT